MKQILSISLLLTSVLSTVSAQSYDIIDEQPEGDVTYYDRESYGWYIFAGGASLQYGRIPGSAKIVWEDDDTVYIQDPLTADKCGNYIIAHRQGNKIRADFPQVLREIADNEGERPLYIGKMVTLIDENGLTYMPAETDDFITWTIHDDGSITMDHDPVELNERGKFTNPDNPPTDVLGTYYYAIDDLTGEYGPIWNAVADWAQTYTPVEIGQTISIPDGLNIETWRMTTKEKTRMVDVAFDGDDIYIGNITEYVDGAIKGYIHDGKAYFPTTQYIGFNEQYNSNAWFISAIAVYEIFFDKPFLSKFDRTDALELVYDPVAKTLTSAPNTAILINASTGETSLFEYMVDPDFRYLSPEGMDAAPRNPVVLVPGESAGYDGLLYSVDIPAENVDGVALNTNNMFYNIYLNGELWTFYNDTYLYFNDDYTDIPYNYTDRYDLQLRGTVHNLYLHEEGIERIGIVSCFIGSDGTIYRSDLIETAVSGIVNIVADKSVVSRSYYNLAGQPVDSPGPGFYIEVTKYADGTVSTTKKSLK